MPLCNKKILITSLLCVAFTGPVLADDEMDAILDAATPHMHHSCESVIANYPDDESKIAEIVRLIAMVSLYNRQIDVLAAVPDEAEREGLKDIFIKELKDACDDDPGRLLAGAVDDAVRTTMAPHE
jgi:hypothetical protein